MNNKTRLIIGIGLILLGLFYQSGGWFPITPSVPDKLDKPDEQTLALVESLPKISDDVDSDKVAGLFYGLSTKLDTVNLNTNLQLQYLLDFVGKKVLKDELVGKYPDFAPAAANLISTVVGDQTETTPLTDAEKEILAKLFYGFAWKLYNKKQDAVFEEYKTKTLSAISEYNNDDDNPNPAPVDDKCDCEGKGYIIHGDGHRTPCACVASGQDCKHNPRCGSVAAMEHRCQCDTETTHCECFREYGACYCNQELMSESFYGSCATGSCSTYSTNDIVSYERTTYRFPRLRGLLWMLRR